MARKQTTKPTPNTPAPGLPETAADVMAAEAAPAASQATASTVVEGEQPSSGDQALSPLGESVVAGDGAGDLLPPLGVVAVIVTSEVEGFRRAGRPWSRTPTTVPIDELSDADLLALEAEPLLQVVYVADHAEKVAG